MVRKRGDPQRITDMKKKKKNFSFTLLAKSVKHYHLCSGHSAFLKWFKTYDFYIIFLQQLNLNLIDNCTNSSAPSLTKCVQFCYLFLISEFD